VICRLNFRCLLLWAIQPGQLTGCLSKRSMLSTIANHCAQVALKRGTRRLCRTFDKMKYTKFRSLLSTLLRRKLGPDEWPASLSHSKVYLINRILASNFSKDHTRFCPAQRGTQPMGSPPHAGFSRTWPDTRQMLTITARTQPLILSSWYDHRRRGAEGHERE
jgi:hypothetical protein